MSTRQLRRLEEERAALKAGQKAEPFSEEDGEEEEEVTGPKKKFNPFDLLSDNDRDESTEEDSSSDSDSPPPPPPPPKKQQPQQQRQGKKKKDEGKGGAKGQPHAKNAAEEEEDELERALREMNLQPSGSQGPVAQGPSAAQEKAAFLSSPAAQLLCVQPRHLNAAAELRRLFGSEAIAAGPSGGRKGRVPPGLRGGGGRGGGGSAKTLKKLMYAQPKAMWPRYDPSTIRIEPYPELSTAARPAFVLKFSDGYEAASELFEQFSYDAQSLEMVLHSCPYHIETLMAFNEMYSKFGEAEAAADLLARALFALEVSLSPLADVTQARCYVPYALPENRVLHKVFFAHMQALIRAGCPRTALEVAKTLLIFDPTDPMGVLLQIDYICLRSNELAFLERLAAQDLAAQMLEGVPSDPDHPKAAALALLPNMSYSLALARKRIEDDPTSASASTPAVSKANREDRDAGGAVLPAWENLGSWDQGALSASEVLKRALLLHPHGLVRLLQRLEEKGFRKDAYWKSYMDREPFASAEGDTGSASLDYLLSLFVERSSQLWRPDPVLLWVKQTVRSLLEEGEVPSACGISLEEWKGVRSQAFPESETRNIYSHVDREAMLEGQQVIPQEALQDQGPPPPNVPPPPRNGPAPLPQQLQGANPVQAFLQALLPWVNVEGDGQPGPAAGEDGNGAAGVAGGGGGGVIGPEDYIWGDSEDDDDAE